MGASMEGKVVLITGATAGIGQAAAVELARRGAAISLVARNPDRAEATARVIADAAPTAPAVRTFLADLADLEAVRSVATEVAKELEHIDVLVNNAGIAARRQRITVDGLDEMLAANYLGPFLLTHLLLDTMRASAPSRIVIVGSEAHRFAGKLDPERFEAFDPYGGVQAQPGVRAHQAARRAVGGRAGPPPRRIGRHGQQPLSGGGGDRAGSRGQARPTARRGCWRPPRSSTPQSKALA